MDVVVVTRYDAGMSRLRTSHLRLVIAEKSRATAYSLSVFGFQTHNQC